MTRKKKRRRKASLLTKAINVGILALAFATPIKLLMKGGTGAIDAIIWRATGGLVTPSGTGTFNKNLAIEFYGPMLAAILLKKAISMVRKSARV